jgi:excisionase family DNA binding protein
MQVESTRLYRVKTVAESLDVSAATIYRAVETGALRAVRMGTGKGAVRIPGQALREYMAACERAAATAQGVTQIGIHAVACSNCGAGRAEGLVLPAELVEAIVRAAGRGVAHVPSPGPATPDRATQDAAGLDVAAWGGES